MTTETRLRDIELTEHEFADLPEEEGYRLELSGGRLVREPAPGPRHGRVAFRLLDLLRRHGEEEVASPSNRASEMQRKVLGYRNAGTRLVWIVDPAAQTVAAYRSRSEIRILLVGEVLDGGDVLPGLSVPVESVFEG